MATTSSTAAPAGTISRAGAGATRCSGASARPCPGGRRAGGRVWAFHSARDAGKGAKADVLSDFAAGVDRIDLRRIDADTASDADDASAFIGDAAFSGAGGEVRYANGRLSGDIVGGGGAEFQIEIANGAILTVDDLLL